jgi:hypothetical protein
VIAAGLVGNEFVTLLSWVLQTYPGPELLRHQDVNIDPTSLGPILSDSTIEKLFQVAPEIRHNLLLYTLLMTFVHLFRNI